MDLATGTIFIAGIATFASPCVLPMIPIYLSVLVGGSLDAEEARGLGRLKLMLNGFMFVLGFTLVFVALGLTATAVGRFFLENRLLFQQIGGLVVFMFGLKFLGWLHIDALEREKRIQLGPSKRISPWGALVMGLTFAFGWTPCIGPVLGAILTFTAVSADSIGDGALNLLVYAAGVGLPLLVVAALAQQGIGLLNRVKRLIPKIEKATGGVLVAMAILMVTDSTSILTFGVGDESSAGISQDMVATVHKPEVVAAVETAVDETSCGENSACDFDPGATGDAAEVPADLANLAQGRPTVVYFHRPDCPACLKMAPIVQAMRETCSGKGLAVRRIDVSQRANRPLAAQHGVRGTPTMIFMEESGAEVARLVGASDLDAVHQAVAVLMGEQCADFTRM